MKTFIKDQPTFQATQKQLEALQALKAPLYNTFNAVVCGNSVTNFTKYTDEHVAEFCFVDHSEDKEAEKLKKWMVKTGNTPGEMEAALEKQFNKLALLLEKYEDQQKKLQISTLEKVK